MEHTQFRKIEPLDIMRYYVAYRDIEKQILADIHSDDIMIKEKALKKYMNSYMKIGRNFRTGTDNMVYTATKNYIMSGEVDVEALSKIYFTNGLLNNKIENAKVAASKLLWLFHQEFIIMDNFNLKVLGVKTDSYMDYIDEWLTVFELKEIEIIETITTYKFEEIDPVMNEKWFRLRVFDQYLWTLANQNIT